MRFGRGALADVPELLGEGYVLLTTPRALAVAPAVGAGAARVHMVGPGLVDELAGALRDEVRGPLLVALGGGRVIDVAKSLAQADPPTRVAAVPTTLSGAEMTAIHRPAPGTPADAPMVRPAIVISDPALSASQDRESLVASALNALGHAAEAPLTPRASPVPTLAALEAARLIAKALDDAEPDREALALAALLGGYAIDASGYGLHHVLSQTLVRFAGVAHGPANAVMLPHTLRALARRFPSGIARLGDALGGDAAEVAARMGAAAGWRSLADLGVPYGRLPELAERAAERPQLDLTPPRPDPGELLDVYRAAFAAVPAS